MMKRNKGKYNKILCVLLTLVFALSGCSDKGPEPVEVQVTEAVSAQSRSNEPVCLKPAPGGENIISADNIDIDLTNQSEGYLYVTYSGDNEDIKLQMSCDDGIMYTYKLKSGDSIIPLTQGSGEYQFIVYEGMGNGAYSTLLADKQTINITNEFGPYLYPSFYVDFDDNTKAVALGKELAATCTCDLEVIATVYEYVIANITYDYEEAETVASNYVPDVDEILETKKGICFDYASLMASILRSQRIPTRLEIGYAGDAYHAWVTTYVEDIGWINGIIQFDGADWTLMDPTFAANSDAKTLKKFIGDGDNYITKYMY